MLRISLEARKVRADLVVTVTPVEDSVIDDTGVER